MNALKNYILESLDDKQVNKLFRQFINNYDDEIGDVLKKAGFYSIVTRGVIAAPDRTMYSAKLWKGMLYRVTPSMKNKFKFLKDKDYEYDIVVDMGLVNPAKKDNRLTPKNFFEVDDVGVYVVRPNGSPLLVNVDGEVDDNREAYTCYLFFNLE